MTLKTVKDIEKEYQEKYNYEDSIPDPDTLREAAKEWIESQRRLQAGIGTKEDCDNIHHMNSAKSILKHFFNLEDENE